MELSIRDEKKFKIITVSGKIDWESARELDNEIQKLIEQGFYHLVFNLDGVKFLCSGGIGALIYNLNKVKTHEGAIYIISSSEYVNYIFDTLKFGVVFDGLIFDTCESFKQEVLDRL